MKVVFAVYRHNAAPFKVLFYAFIQSFAIDTMGLEYRVGCSLQVRVRMRKADDKRWSNNSLPDHFVHEKRAKCLRRLSLLIASSKNQIKGPAKHFEEALQAVLFNRSIHQRPQFLAAPPQVFHNILFAIGSDHL